MSVDFKLVRPKGRKFILIRWHDGKRWREKSSKKTRVRDAERIAPKLIEEAGDGEKISWAEFCVKYEREHVAHLKVGALNRWKTTKNWINELMRLDTLDQIDAQFCSTFATRCFGKQMSAASVATHLARLRAAMRWAEDLELIDSAPKINLPRRARGPSKMMRSRPVTAEEFDRIITAVPKVRPKDPEPWKDFIRGLWHSGFRVDELRQLSWEPTAAWSIDTSHRFPLVRILAEGEKAGQDRWQPMTSDFWNLIKNRPRTGYVFPMFGRNGKQMSVKRIIRIISKIGRMALVITDASTRKHATSHDIGRRAFATRLGEILTIQELTSWMRHASSETTVRYYHAPTAIRLAERVWHESGGIPGGISSGADSGQEPTIHADDTTPDCQRS